MGTQESEATLRQQIAETGGSQSLEQPTGGATSAGTVPAPPAPATVPPVGVSKALLEEILEETANREVPTEEEHLRRLELLGTCITKGLTKAVGRILNYGGKPENYLYFEAPLVFAIAKEARCQFGIKRLGNGKGYDRWKEDGVDVFYAEGWAQCPMIDASIGTGEHEAGVGNLVTSEDKFMKGTLKSAGEWGHRSNLMRKTQTQAMRKACVKILGLDGITQRTLEILLKVRSEKLGKNIQMPHITTIGYGG